MGRSPEKKNALPKFLAIFLRGAFLVNKGVFFFQKANNLNFKLFLGCIMYMYIYIV